MKNPASSYAKSSDIQVTNPDGLRPVYANIVGASATLTDVRLFFTEVGANPVGGKGSEELKALVTIPLVAALHLQDVLKQVMEGQKKLVEEMKAENGNRVVKQ